MLFGLAAVKLWRLGEMSAGKEFQMMKLRERERRGGGSGVVLGCVVNSR